MDSIYRFVDIIDKTLVDEIIHLDIRAFNLFWEHKLLMALRLEYMVDNLYLNSDENSYLVIIH